MNCCIASEFLASSLARSRTLLNLQPQIEKVLRSRPAVPAPVSDRASRRTPGRAELID